MKLCKKRLMSVGLLLIFLLLCVADKGFCDYEIELASYTFNPEVKALILKDPSIVQEKLKAAMFKKLKNPSSLFVEIETGTPEEVSDGYIKRAVVRSSGGNASGLILDKADVEFIDVRLNMEDLILREDMRPVELHDVYMDVVVTEEALNDLVLRKSKKVKVRNPKILLRNNKVKLSGSTKYGFIRATFEAEGRLAIKDEKEICFYASRMKVNRMNMPRSFVGMIVKRMNPVLDLDDMPFRLKLKTINIKNGYIEFSSR